MADDHHSLRLPAWLWKQYGRVVGDLGKTADLKLFVAWQIDDPAAQLGHDVDTPYDFIATFRVEDPLWQLFVEALDGQEYSGVLRAYIRWRVQHPDEPLPGRRVPPIRRQSRRPVACV